MYTTSPVATGKRNEKIKTMIGCKIAKILAVLIKSIRRPVFFVRAIPNIEEKVRKIERGTLKLDAPNAERVNKKVAKKAIFFDFKIYKIIENKAEGKTGIIANVVENKFTFCKKRISKYKKVLINKSKSKYLSSTFSANISFENKKNAIT